MPYGKSNGQEVKDPGGFFYQSARVGRSSSFAQLIQDRTSASCSGDSLPKRLERLWRRERYLNGVLVDRSLEKSKNRLAVGQVGIGMPSKSIGTEVLVHAKGKPPSPFSHFSSLNYVRRKVFRLPWL